MAGMDLSVRPQDDFFRYVNGRWFDATPIPADQSGYGSFAILRERSQEAVRNIIEAEGRSQAARRHEQPEDRRPLQELHGRGARSSRWASRRSRASWRASRGISDARELPAAFAHAVAASACACPSPSNVGTDQRNSDQYAVQVSQSGLGHARSRLLPAHRRRFADTRKAYTTYIARLFALAQPARSRRRRRAHRRARDRLAEKQWDRARNRDRNATYNKMGVGRRCRRRRRTSTGRRTSAALPGDAEGQGHRRHRPAAGLPEGASTRSSRTTPVATWKEYLTFGLISKYADGAVGAVRRRAVRVQRQGDRRAPAGAAARGSAASPRSSRRSASRSAGSTSRSISSPRRRRAWTR